MSIVAQFAAFRKLSSKATNTQVARDIDHETLMRSLVNTDAFKEATMPTKQRPHNSHGAGVAPSRVNALAQRIATLEASSGGGAFNYLAVTDTGTTTYTLADLPKGSNIIGVNAPGPVTLRLPHTLSAGTVVKIKDESLAAFTNNITVETYLEI